MAEVISFRADHGSFYSTFRSGLHSGLTSTVNVPLSSWHILIGIPFILQCLKYFYERTELFNILALS